MPNKTPIFFTSSPNLQRTNRGRRLTAIYSLKQFGFRSRLSAPDALFALARHCRKRVITAGIASPSLLPERPTLSHSCADRRPPHPWKVKIDTIDRSQQKVAGGALRQFDQPSFRACSVRCCSHTLNTSASHVTASAAQVQAPRAVMGITVAVPLAIPQSMSTPHGSVEVEG
jgi:hypothetical protein